MEASGLDRAELLLAVAVVLSLVDGLMTLPHWHLEGNPVVLAIGPTGMVLTKLIAGVSALVCYRYLLKGTDYSWVGKASGTGLCLLYGIVVTTNVLVLLS